VESSVENRLTGILLLVLIVPGFLPWDVNHGGLCPPNIFELKGKHTNNKGLYLTRQSTKNHLEFEMKRFRVFPAETTFYHSTCTIVDWLPVFQADAYFRTIIDSLKFCRLYKGLYLLAYVIMPTHLHLVTANSEQTTLSEIMRDFRQFTSKQIRRLLEEDGRTVFLELFKNAAKNLIKQDYKIWTNDFHPIALKSEKWIKQKIDYIHFNPVRKGFVELPEQWKYSSAINWILGDDQIIELDRDAL
jgi:putative transposase